MDVNVQVPEILVATVHIKMTIVLITGHLFSVIIKVIRNRKQILKYDTVNSILSKNL